MDIASVFAELMAAEAVLLKLGLGSFFGLCLGLTGVGGGVLLIPMLQLFCDMTPVLAVGTASLISAFVKVNASFVHVRAKNVSWRPIILLFVGAIPATILITQVVVYFSQHPIYQEMTQSTIALLVTVVMVGSLMSVSMKYRAYQHGVNSHVVLLNQPYKGRRKAILSGVFCGSVLGSTGVGGGILLLPVLNSLLNVDIKKAIGSSVVLALLLSSVAALGYAKGGQADWITAIWFVLGASVGVLLASFLLGKMTEKITYLITMAVIGVSLLLYLFA